MPGTIDHTRPCTSTYFTPFRPYTADAIIDYTLCESATNNELVLLSTSEEPVDVILKASFPIKDGFTEEFPQETIRLEKGKPHKISGLFAAQYTLGVDSEDDDVVANVLVSSSEMFVNGAQPAFIQQTFPKQPFVVLNNFEPKPSSEIFGISAKDFPVKPGQVNIPVKPEQDNE